MNLFALAIDIIQSLLISVVKRTVFLDNGIAVVIAEYLLFAKHTRKKNTCMSCIIRMPVFCIFFGEQKQGSALWPRSVITHR